MYQKGSKVGMLGAVGVPYMHEVLAILSARMSRLKPGLYFPQRNTVSHVITHQ